MQLEVFREMLDAEAAAAAIGVAGLTLAGGSMSGRDGRQWSAFIKATISAGANS